MLDDDIVQAARRLLDICKRKNLTVATAESCTAGLVAGTLTEIPGVSRMLDRGFVTYSNQAKQDMLGVAAATLARHGAVSPQTAAEMAHGALARAPVDLVISVTGIAGPDGGSAEKPVGLVYFAAASRSGQFAQAEKRFGEIGRAEIRKQSVLQAFRMLHDLAEREAARPPRG
jgi:nicotinamide-nucleotide amidase